MTSRIESILAAIVAVAILALATWWHLGQVKKAERAVHAHYSMVLADQEDEATRYEAGLYFCAANWESDNAFVLMLGERVGLDTPEKLQAAFSQAQTL